MNENVNTQVETEDEEHLVPVECRSRYLSSDATDEIVQFLFHLIAPAVFHSHSLTSNKEYFRSIAGINYELPDHTIRSFSVSSLERYLRNYRATGNLDGLFRKKRADKGISRSLTPKAESRIIEIISEVPNATVPSVMNRLKNDHVISEGECSMDSIRRFIDKQELRKLTPDIGKLRNRYIVPHAGDMYVADTLYYEKLGKPVANKKSPWLYVQGIIDDHSRLMLTTETYTEDNALNFQCTLRKAISLYGIPERLYVDLGSPYNNHDLTLICNRLGIDLIHAPPHDGAAKGVIESKWRSLMDETRVDIVLDNLTTQEELDARVQKWRHDYNKRTNSGVGGIPIERYNASVKEKPIRRVASLKELSEAFSHERIRVLDNLGLIHLDNVKYKAPDELRYLVKGRVKVKVVYDPLNMEETIHILHDGKKYPMKVDDPLENGRENARKALERAREAKSCTGMTTAEIRAENRYRVRMAGTNRVPVETPEDNSPSDSSPEFYSSVPVSEMTTDISVDAELSAQTPADQSATVTDDEETIQAIPFIYD